jgi:acetolactate synthase I/II/III large subunit
MNGAQALIRALTDQGVDVAFMNPGTSEMHFVAALDTVPEMRGVLVLFEGVATGAADGYGRMVERPAATLLHLGPGLGNGLANLHNARRAHTPVVNIVGDHATYHKAYDPQLESDIETVARNVSGFIRRGERPDDVVADALDTVAAALGPPGQVATLILPADASWSEVSADAATWAPAARPTPAEPAVDVDRVETAAEVLRSDQAAALFVGGRVVRGQALRDAAAVCAATGARLVCETFPARLERGAGVPPVERLGYLAEFATAQLDGLAHLVLVDAPSPVSFFAYPGKASDLVPPGCEVHHLAGPDDDAAATLVALLDALDAPRTAVSTARLERPDAPSGALTAESVGTALGALLPEGAIVSDEGNTTGLFTAGATAGAPPHDWLCLTGGAIGQGLPVAVGASVACPDRRVIAFESDGSALYTLQSLWTMARESLDVTTIILNNRSYAVLNMELNRVGADAAGPKARRMLDLSGPDLDFVALAQGMGVPATRATTADELVEQLGRSLASPGPSLIDAIVPSIV